MHAGSIYSVAFFFAHCKNAPHRAEVWDSMGRPLHPLWTKGMGWTAGTWG